MVMLRKPPISSADTASIEASNCSKTARAKSIAETSARLSAGDQRSAVSIARSSAGGTSSNSASTPLAVGRCRRRQQPSTAGAVRYRRRTLVIPGSSNSASCGRSGGGGGGGGGGAVACNSSVDAKNDNYNAEEEETHHEEEEDDEQEAAHAAQADGFSGRSSFRSGGGSGSVVELPFGWRYGRKSLPVNQRMGKSVCIAANSSAVSNRGVRSSRIVGDAGATKSIMKLPRSASSRRNTPEDVGLPQSLHNEDSATPGRATAQTEASGQSLHQMREQKIFSELRFIPSDSFYKKVVVAPNQDRQFFAAPRFTRGPGSGMLYDIAKDNRRHHQDCNFDFTRDQLRACCSTYCRPSQFRHIY